MQNLPDESKSTMKQLLGTTLEKFLMTQIIDWANPEQVAEMNVILGQADGINRLIDYVRSNYDPDGNLMEKILSEFQREIIDQMKRKENL
jgi:hypothetical protein